MADKTDDYTKYRSTGVVPYEIEDIIGRYDYIKVKASVDVVDVTASGVVLV